MVLEKTLENPLDSNKIKLVNPECSLEELMLKLKLQYSDTKSQLIGEDPDSGKQKGMTEDKVAGQHHLLNGHAFEQTLGDGKGQGSM